MNTITVKSQKEIDNIASDFKGTVYVEGGERYNPLVLQTTFDEANIIVRGESFVRLRGSSHAELRGSSHAELWGSSHAVLWESSHAVLRGSSHAVLWESSHAVLRGSSHAVLWESSHAVLRGSSHAVLRGSSHVSAKSAKEITCNGYNVISLRKSNQDNITLVMNKDSYLKLIPDFKPTWKEYTKRYPVNVTDEKAILYKAVHRDSDGSLYSDYDENFEYKLGAVINEKCDKNKEESCSKGLHVSHKSYAIEFGRSWSNMVLLECEVSIKNIVVSKDCDGKVRTSELKVLREVPKEEFYL